jgi:two-component system response regulator AtoC
MAAVSAELSRRFMEYEWPGNVRQIENMSKRMLLIGSEAPILTELQQPSSLFPIRSQQSSAPAPRSAVPPTAPVQMAPPPASPATVEPEAGSPQTARAAGNVSLKDIARSAARGAERELILRMLTRTRWNRKEAAEILGISYKALLYKIKENGLDKAS